ncbi:unnamed protein product [Callosobruchus maculatus]|uniref:Sphingomyelin synthase-like domain-containing protein n=1 Tax=Callosobruchus maculatus TaxID=64391 RepID=A0A653CN26_CALMS|nr:unnamed protein product [Callosobruchus maculatus]
MFKTPTNSQSKDRHECIVVNNNNLLVKSNNSNNGSGYEADESGGSSCSVQRYTSLQSDREVQNREPWITALSEPTISYEQLEHPEVFQFADNLEIRKRENGKRMIESKFVDYGSIHPEVSRLPPQNHSLVNSRSGTLSPHSDEEPSSTSNEVKMTQEYLYQRQPLLPNPAKTTSLELSTHSSSGKEYYDDDEDDIPKSRERNGHVAIDLPPPIREEPRFPQERWKTALAAVIMMFNFILTLISLSLVHERVPDRDVYGPLPDVFLDNVPAYDWALDVSEYIIIVCINTSMITMIFHKHRWIVFRRIFLIMSLLYMYRAITMYVTVLPISSKTYPCSPKLNETSPLIIAKRVVKLMSGFGLAVNGQHTYCGDFIYSGHTYSLRQLDLSLLSQLWSLNESIQDFRQMLQEQEERGGAGLSPPSPSPTPSSGEDADPDDFYVSATSLNFRPPSHFYFADVMDQIENEIVKLLVNNDNIQADSRVQNDTEI